MDEFKFALGIACLAVGAIFLAALAIGLMIGVLPNPNPVSHVPTLAEWVMVGLFIIGIGLVLIGVFLLFLYFGEAYEEHYNDYRAKYVYSRAITNIYETVVIIAILGIAGALVFAGKLDSGVFVNIMMLVIGYLTKVALDYVREKLE